MPALVVRSGPIAEMTTMESLQLAGAAKLVESSGIDIAGPSSSKTIALYNDGVASPESAASMGLSAIESVFFARRALYEGLGSRAPENLLLPASLSNELEQVDFGDSDIQEVYFAALALDYVSGREGHSDSAAQMRRSLVDRRCTSLVSNQPDAVSYTVELYFQLQLSCDLSSVVNFDRLEIDAILGSDPSGARTLAVLSTQFPEAEASARAATQQIRSDWDSHEEIWFVAPASLDNAIRAHLILGEAVPGRWVEVLEARVSGSKLVVVEDAGAVYAAAKALEALGGPSEREEFTSAISFEHLEPREALLLDLSRNGVASPEVVEQAVAASAEDLTIFELLWSSASSSEICSEVMSDSIQNAQEVIADNNLASAGPYRLPALASVWAITTHCGYNEQLPEAYVAELRHLASVILASPDLPSDAVLSAVKALCVLEEISPTTQPGFLRSLDIPDVNISNEDIYLVTASIRLRAARDEDTCLHVS